VSDDISRVGFWLFRLRLPGIGPNCKREEFRSKFHWQFTLGKNLCLLCLWLAF